MEEISLQLQHIGSKCCDRLHNLEHYQQKYHWDCGVSCVLMVLPATARASFINQFNKVVEEEGFGESTWTIDLCYLLHRFEVKFSYLTTTIGIDPGYSNQNFYDKVLSKDSARVNDRFNEAKSLNMKVEKKTVSAQDIIRQLEKGPVIVLVNANQLICVTCPESSVSCYSSCLRLCSTSYMGHYIVLVGHCREEANMFYRNPTHSSKVCSIPVAKFEECRTAYGTDEDIIFIHQSS